jgi:hypothetical protein
MALKFGGLISRMASIQEMLAQVDHNLRVAYDSDLVRYAGPKREVVQEAYQICDKLGLVQPLSLNLRHAYAGSCLCMAYYQEEDGKSLDLDLIRKAEQLWASLLRDTPADMESRGFLVIVRRKLADELESKGQRDEAMRWRSQSLTTARGDANLFLEIAVEYARPLSSLGRLLCQLNPHQVRAHRQRSLENTIAMIREAVADGFKDARQLRDDPRLAPVRSDPEFQAIVSDLEFPAQPFARP